VVVEGGVEAELVEQVADLRRRPCTADDAVAAQLGDLCREAADGAGRGRDPDHVALAQLGGVDQADPGGERHVADGAEELLRRRERGVDPRERAHAPERGLASPDHGVVAPAPGVRDRVTGHEALRA
jgi:hypothetical protein